MLSNVKFPHWVSLAVSLVALVLGWVMHESATGNLTLPALVMAILPTVNAVIAILSPSVNNSTNVNAVVQAQENK